MRAKQESFRRVRWGIMPVVLAVAATLTVSAQDRTRHVIQDEQTFKVSGTPHVLVSTFDGTIRIESWDRPEVRCQVEKRGRTQSDVDRIEIIASQNGNDIQYEAKARSRVNWNSNLQANLTINVPRQANLTARSGDGNIDARDVTGEISLHTGDGSVTASRLSGILNVQTGDGSMDLTDMSGRLQAQTGDGRMNIRGRFTELDARTGDGSMDVAIESGSEMNSAWSLKTGDGSIQLGLPDGFSAELDVHTNDGAISTELPVMISGKLGHTLRGRLNQGGKTLTVQTGDGSITLRRN